MTPNLKIASGLATLLDNQFTLGQLRFGLDAIIDLLPVGGDTIILLLSCYIIWTGVKLGLPQSKVITMIMNTLIGFLIGLIPFIGDLVYFTFKPNLRNLRILEQHVNQR